MGRIKTQQIKRTVKELMTKYPESFATDFEKNKLLLKDRAEIPSKKLRNVVAGSLTKRIKASKE